MPPSSEAVPVHVAFHLPKTPLEGLWSARAFKTRQSPEGEFPAMGAHPRLVHERPCAACNYPVATCVHARGSNFMGNIVEEFEYACPTCGAFTTYKLWF